MPPWARAVSACYSSSLSNIPFWPLALGFSVPVAMAVTGWLRTVQFTYVFRPVLNLTTDWSALGIGMAAGLFTAVLAGIAPAIKTARSGIASGSKPALPAAPDCVIYSSAARLPVPWPCWCRPPC